MTEKASDSRYDYEIPTEEETPRQNVVKASDAKYDYEIPDTPDAEIAAPKSEYLGKPEGYEPRQPGFFERPAKPSPPAPAASHAPTNVVPPPFQPVRTGAASYRPQKPMGPELDPASLVPEPVKGVARVVAKGADILSKQVARQSEAARQLARETADGIMPGNTALQGAAEGVADALSMAADPRVTYGFAAGHGLAKATLGAAAPLVDRAIQAGFGTLGAKDVVEGTTDYLLEKNITGDEEAAREGARKATFGASLVVPTLGAAALPGLAERATQSAREHYTARAQNAPVEQRRALLDELGLDPTATPEQVKSAVRQIVRETHPDVAGQSPATRERFDQAIAARDEFNRVPPTPESLALQPVPGKNLPLRAFEAAEVLSSSVKAGDWSGALDALRVLRDPMSQMGRVDRLAPQHTAWRAPAGELTPGATGPFEVPPEVKADIAKEVSRDREDAAGIPGEVGVGKEPVEAEPVAGASGEAPRDGGVVQGSQAGEEVPGGPVPQVGPGQEKVQGEAPLDMRAQEQALLAGARQAILFHKNGPGPDSAFPPFGIERVMTPAGEIWFRTDTGLTMDRVKEMAQSVEGLGKLLEMPAGRPKGENPKAVSVIDQDGNEVWSAEIDDKTRQATLKRATAMAEKIGGVVTETTRKQVVAGRQQRAKEQEKIPLPPGPQHPRPFEQGETVLYIPLSGKEKEGVIGSVLDNGKFRVVDRQGMASIVGPEKMRRPSQPEAAPKREAREGSAYEGEDLDALEAGLIEEQKARLAEIRALMDKLTGGRDLRTVGAKTAPGGRREEKLRVRLNSLSAQYAAAYEEFAMAGGDPVAARKKVEERPQAAPMTPAGDIPEPVAGDTIRWKDDRGVEHTDVIDAVRRAGVTYRVARFTNGNPTIVQHNRILEVTPPTADAEVGAKGTRYEGQTREKAALNAGMMLRQHARSINELKAKKSRSKIDETELAVLPTIYEDVYEDLIRAGFPLLARKLRAELETPPEPPKKGKKAKAAPAVDMNRQAVANHLKVTVGSGWEEELVGLDRAAMEFEAEGEGTKAAFWKDLAASTIGAAPEPPPPPKPAVAPKVETKSWENAATGPEGVVETATGTEIPFTYAVVEADEPITSHDSSGTPNAGYALEGESIQNRDRSDQKSVEQMGKIKGNPKLRLLAESPTTNDGAPLVRPDKRVLAGNGRMAGLAAAHEAGTAEQYKKDLPAKLKQLGFDEAAIEKAMSMERPALVRLMKPGQEHDQTRLARDTNVSTGLTLGPAEKGRSDAGVMMSPGSFDQTSRVLALYEANDDANLTSPANRPFVESFAKAFVPETERGSMFSEGRLTPDGASRVRAALVAGAYGNSPVVDRLLEGGGSETAALRTALINAAPDFAIVKMRQRMGELEQLDVVKPVVEAAEFINDMRNDGRSLESVLRPKYGELISATDRLSPEGLELVQLIDQNKGPKGAKILSGTFRELAQVAAALTVEKDQGGLFGEGEIEKLPVPKLTEALKIAKENYEAKREAEDSPLFAGIGREEGEGAGAAAPERGGGKPAPGAKDTPPDDQLAEGESPYGRVNLYRKRGEAADRLAKEIDRRYEAGELDGIEDLERRLEVIEGDASEEDRWGFSSHGNANEVEGEDGLPSIVDELARGYARYLDATAKNGPPTGKAEWWQHDSDSALQHLRSIIEGSDDPAWRGQRPAGTYTDEQILDTAKDAYEHKKALREKYKNARPGELDRAKAWLRQRGVEISEEAAAYGQPAIAQPTFFSALSRAVDAIPFKSIPAADLYARLTKTPGVKKEELEWVGLPQWLKERDRVTKDEVKAFIDENNVEVRTITRGDFDHPAELTKRKEQANRARAKATDKFREIARRDGTDPGAIDMIAMSPMLFNSFENLKSDEARTALAALRDASSAQSKIEDEMLAFRRANPSPKYESYTLRGGENYREVLLQKVNTGEEGLEARRKEIMRRLDEIAALPSKEHAARPELTSEHDRLRKEQWRITQRLRGMSEDAVSLLEQRDEISARMGRVAEERTRVANEDLNASRRGEKPDYVEWARLENEMSRLREEYHRLDKKLIQVNGNTRQPRYDSGHFDTPNILVHYRVKDRIDADGKKVYALEEVQSDWHEEGRKRGYDTGAKEVTLYQVVPKGRPDRVYSTFHTREEAQREIDSYDGKTRDFLGIFETKVMRGGEGVPDAPFKKTWPLLAFKHALRYAAENGYDKIAWTPGSVQNERYDLSKQVRSISWVTYQHDTGEKSVTIRLNAGNDVEFLARPDGTVTGYSGRVGNEFDGKKLDDVVGKEIAKGILEKPHGEVSESGLSIGGEGMKGFYDKILPAEIGKYIKPWGGKVGETRLGALAPATRAGLMDGDVVIPDWVERVEGGEDPEHPDWTEGEIPNTDDGPQPGDFVPENTEGLYVDESGITGDDGQEEFAIWDRNDPDGPPVEEGFATLALAHARLAVLRGTAPPTERPEPPTPATVFHSVEITPAMRESVLAGQPLFEQGSKYEQGKLFPGGDNERNPERVRNAGTGTDAEPVVASLAARRRAALAGDTAGEGGLRGEGTGAGAPSLAARAASRRAAEEHANRVLDELVARIRAGVPGAEGADDPLVVSATIIAKELKERGFVSLLGYKIPNIEAAGVVAQITARSDFEISRIALMDDDGIVLDEIALSCALPSTVYQGHPDVSNEAIIEQMRRVGATQLCDIHGHPSGDPEPSPPDVRVTAKRSEIPGYMGHAVIDHDSFCTIPPNPKSKDDYTRHRLTPEQKATRPKLFKNPDERDSSDLGLRATTAEEFARIAINQHTDQRSVTLVFVGGLGERPNFRTPSGHYINKDSHVRAVASVPIEKFLDYGWAKQRFRTEMASHGANHLLAYHTGEGLTPEEIQKLYDVALDLFYSDNTLSDFIIGSPRNSIQKHFGADYARQTGGQQEPTGATAASKSPARLADERTKYGWQPGDPDPVPLADAGAAGSEYKLSARSHLGLPNEVGTYPLRGGGHIHTKTRVITTPKGEKLEPGTAAHDWAFRNGFEGDWEPVLERKRGEPGELAEAPAYYGANDPYEADGRSDRERAFDRWFEGSVVTNEDGSPRVMYHGTSSPHDFDTFWTQGYNVDLGAHFGTPAQANDIIGTRHLLKTTDPKEANALGGHAKPRKIYPVYLSIKNPLRLPDLDGWVRPMSYLTHLPESVTGAEKQLRDLAKEVQTAFEGGDTGVIEDFPGMAKQLLEDMGYDGIVYVNENEAFDEEADSYIAFHPWQIKSATGNKGTFDPANKSILHEGDTDYGVPPMREKGIPADAPHVALARNTQALQGDPDYKEAKAGDREAAVRLVNRLVTDEAVARAKVFGKDVTYVFPHAEEMTGRNKIPATVATKLAEETGGNVTGDIIQANRVHHTGASAKQRFVARPTFEGPVQKGTRYVIVDDVTTFGNTLAELANHIQKNGGEVAGTFVLADASRTPTLAPERRRVDALETRLGDALRETLGLDPAALTRPEVDYFLGFKSPESLRATVVTARRERDDRLRAKGVSEEDAPYGNAKPGLDREKNLQKWAGKTVVRNGDGSLKRVYHGTVSEFDIFSQKKASVEADLGAGFYFTSNPDDASVNYGSDKGADLENKVEYLAERIQGEMLDAGEEGDTEALMNLARDKAREQLGVQHGGAVLPVYLRIEKPLVLGGPGEPYWDYEYDEENDSDKGELTDLFEAMRVVRNGIEADGGDVGRDEYDRNLQKLYDYAGNKASKLLAIVKDAFVYAEDENGNLISGEAVRRVVEKMGYDGIVDHTVDIKFGTRSPASKYGKAMHGVTGDTVHYIVFSPNQIKSATGNRGTFSRRSASLIKEEDSSYGKKKSALDYASRFAPGAARALKPRGPEDEIRLAATDPAAGVFSAIFASRAPKASKTSQLPSPLDSHDPAVEARLRAAEGIVAPSILARVKQSFVDLEHSFTRHFIELDTKESKTIAADTDILRQLEASPDYAKSVALDTLAYITDGLDKPAARLFTRILALRDLHRSIDEGLYEDKDELPFGYEDKAAVTYDLRKYEALAKEDEAVAGALAKREKYASELTQKLVDMELLPEDVLEDDRYYHRQVMAVFNQKQAAYVGTGSQDVRVHRKGFQKARSGGGDFNMRYQEAEFEWMAQAHSLIAMREALDRLREGNDIKPALERNAKWQNTLAIYGGIENYQRVQALKAEKARIYTEAGIALESDEKKRIAAINAELEEIDPLKPFTDRMGWSIHDLGKRAEEGELDHAPDWLQEAVDELRASSEWEEFRGDSESELFFPLLNYLVSAGKGGSKEAAYILKAVADKKKFIKDELGKDFKTWRDLIPDTHPLAPKSRAVVWQPEKGSIFYRAQTLPERALERFLEEIRSEDAGDVVDKEAVEALLGKAREALVKGGPKQEWVIPEGLAHTLDNWKGGGREKGFESTWVTLQQGWKQWVLLNPVRALRYNLNNESGDVDVVIAAFPGALRGWAQAARDLWKYTVKEDKSDTALVEEIQRATKLGVISSGHSFQEIPDINEAGAFKGLTSDDPNVVQKTLETYWSGTKKFSTWRENTLRLAVFRYLEKELKAGAKLYGASRRHEVDAIKDTGERAAKIARELVGDYGNISVSGQYIRRHLIPFYSWMEINAPRYVRLLKNAAYEDRSGGGGGRGGDGRGGRGGGGGAAGRVAAVGAKKIAVNYAKLALFAPLLYGAIQAWNHLVFPEEEKLLAGNRKTLHLILGRNGDGSIRSIRLQGALSDALEWFGAGNVVSDVMDIASGKRTLRNKLNDALTSPIDKIVGGWEPFSKTLFELGFGYRSYPSLFKEGTTDLAPKKIRDRAEYAGDVVWPVGALYRKVTGKPRRPSPDMGVPGAGPLLDTLLVARTDPGEASYWYSRNLAAKFLEEQGKAPSSTGGPTGEAKDRADALYYFKRACEWGDDDAAGKWLAEYYELGGTPQKMNEAFVREHPLGGLPLGQRGAFVSSLSEEDRAVVQSAVEWYEKGRERMRETASVTTYVPTQRKMTAP